MARSTVVLFTFSLVASAFARVVDYQFDVANGILSDWFYAGWPTRALSVNGRFPGPLISASKGDTIKVTVRNKLSDPTMRRSTTIHWHGLFQHRTAEDDGPAFVTQCPIPPQESYTYNLSLDDQTGTYWYHSHLSSQYVDGLRGPLVIYPKDPYRNYYDVDDESTIFTLADWYHTPSEEIMAAHDVLKTIPDSGTINGKGKYDPASANNNTVQLDNLYKLKVKRGKRYRLRIINASAIASFRFSIQGHKCTIIEADGILTKPIEVDAFDILAGQRYTDQDPDSYWINAPITNVLNTNVQAMLEYDEDRRPSHYPWKPFLTWRITNEVIRYWQHKHGSHGHKGKGHHHKVRAIGGGSGLNSRVKSRASELSRKAVELAAALVANEAELDKRQNQDNSTVVLDETKLVPLIQPGAPGGSRDADVVVPLVFGLNFGTGMWTINNISYSPPDVPTLLKILSDKGHVDASDLYVSFVPDHAINAQRIAVRPTSSLISFPRTKLSSYTSRARAWASPILFTCTADVVGARDEGVRIRFRTDNPGPWFLHCHIDWHMDEGFNVCPVVFAEAPEDIKKGSQSVRPNGQWKKLCEKYEKLPDEFLFGGYPIRPNPLLFLGLWSLEVIKLGVLVSNTVQSQLKSPVGNVSGCLEGYAVKIEIFALVAWPSGYFYVILVPFWSCPCREGHSILDRPIHLPRNSYSFDSHGSFAHETVNLDQSIYLNSMDSRPKIRQSARLPSAVPIANRTRGKVRERNRTWQEQIKSHAMIVLGMTLEPVFDQTFWGSNFQSLGPEHSFANDGCQAQSDKDQMGSFDDQADNRAGWIGAVGWWTPPKTGR
ncbi:laccase, multicopper oxidase, benzenediol:oxygen oxidorectuctase [Rhizoctonia solani AG-1 IA]|uniref:Laccase, multicopper oxidase, benzenediol:oxygen oxidorectuctase n=1 Tax=Thanatephorus cucumeris (strain AG1-IA) TaxID=983506 RepID=L8WY78_THACA|nr:laccase, multicopper oxidase, benzenediol:oxygen oxidorectuctase [Rhizoctonia solani AG-1 IA]